MKKAEITKNKFIEWEQKDIERLSINQLKILNIFVEQNKLVLNSNEIQEALKLRGAGGGKKIGAMLASFSKPQKKEPLFFPILKIGVGKSRWFLQEKYFSLIKEVLSKLAPYLDK